MNQHACWRTSLMPVRDPAAFRAWAERLAVDDPHITIIQDGQQFALAARGTLPDDREMTEEERREYAPELQDTDGPVMFSEVGMEIDFLEELGAHLPDGARAGVMQVASQGCLSMSGRSSLISHQGILKHTELHDIFSGLDIHI